MKKLLILFLALANCMNALFAALTYTNESVDGIYYEFNDVTQTASVTYKGWSAGSMCNDYPNPTIVIPTSVTYNNITYQVTSIGESAFFDCPFLTSVTIPESVTSIGSGAFSTTGIYDDKSNWENGALYINNCLIATENIFDHYTIKDNTRLIAGGAFRNCSSLTSVTIPNSVTSIGDDAFYKCSSLTSVTIPNSVTSIGNSAFYDCSSLTSVTIPNSVTSIGDDAFYGTGIYNTELNWEGGVLYISNCLIRAKSNIRGSYTIKDNSRLIANGAFRSCYSLTSITIPNSVTSIGNSAFYDCSKLTSVTIPNSVTSIGSYAFDYCSSLAKTYYMGDVADWCNIKFGNYSANPIYRSGYLYINDQEIKDLVIPNSVTSIGSYAFRGCSSLTSVTIPNSVTSIGDYAFQGCTSLTSVTIGNSVTSIGIRVFYSCSSLTSPVYNAHCFAYMPTSFKGAYTIPDGIKQIAGDAFSGCSALTSITIPNSVTSIGDEAFYGCYRITSITCEATTPPTMVEYAFDWGSYSIPVYVPCGTVLAYNAAGGWSSFYNIQEPLAEYSIQVSASNSLMGTAQVDKNNGCGCNISAIANYRYHFVQWSDGNTDNPRSLELTRDTVLTAEFALNNYTLSIQSDNSERGTTSGDITTTYLDYVTISATANYGYHFSHWNDYNYDNPRKVQVTEDKTYTAYFDKNTYYITKNYDSNQGYVNGYSSGKYLDNITLTAEANYGYHFVQWSDGVIDNSRSFVLTQDTTFVAVFAPNNYTISTLSSDIERGTTSGDITTTYLDYVTISATANYGYHFSHWNDYNYDNPRKVQVTEDKTYTAYFDKNTYYITKNYDSNQGYVNGYSSGEYLDNIALTAEPNYGYHFVRWADGNTDNPRHFILTQDTAFSAEFAQTFSGQCGDNLYWSYQNNSLIISGFGEMYDERPWGLFINEIQHVVLPNGITHIGDDAFSDCTGLNEITIPYTVTSIGDYAFAGCRKLVHVNCYAINPPIAETTSFANYNVYLNVPCDNLQDYKLDMVFGSFKYLQCMEADSENVPTDTVIVTPGTNDVTITWPTDKNADTYKIEIKRGDVVFCTLTFDKDGMLTNIAFAPSRSGSHPVTYAASTGNGLRFTVTSLDAATTYGYNVTTKDEEDNTLSSYTGEFTTKGNVTTDMDNIQSPVTTCQKVMRNGQLIILRDGKTYTTMGAEM